MTHNFWDGNQCEINDQHLNNENFPQLFLILAFIRKREYYEETLTSGEYNLCHFQANTEDMADGWDSAESIQHLKFIKFFTQ